MTKSVVLGIIRGVCKQMQASFGIVADRQNDMIRLTMSGFFSLSDVHELSSKLIRTIATLGCGANQHKTLCDIREMKIQSQETVTTFQSLVGSDAVRSSRLAFVAGTSLARMQASRLTDREGVRFFATITDAEAWLQEAQ